MRAYEFITEATGRGSISNLNQFATVGLNVFSDAERINSDYTLNRVMMAVASTDGKTISPIHKDSWVGKYKSAHPYTKEEQAMIKLAYEAVGAEWKDINQGDLNSRELDSTNKQSPMKPFNGYKK
jgi:hypothetical protein